jgi:hypothetical protein
MTWTGGILSSRRSLLERVVRKLEISESHFVPRFIKNNAAHLAAPFYLSYTTKLRYKIAHDRNPQLITYNDKLLVRGFVASRVGSQVLPRVYASGASFNPEWLTGLPERFVIKTNHGSGALIVVSPDAPIDAKLPSRVAAGDWSTFHVRAENLNPHHVSAITAQWLSQNFARRNERPYLWSYDHVSPQVYVEEFLEDANGGVPADIKFWMFNGKCELIMMVTERMTGSRVAFFDGRWNRLNLSVATERSLPLGHKVTPPKDSSELMRIAERISVGMDATRIDLYETSDGIKFGEITNYCMSAIIDFTPRSFERRLGRGWRPRYRGLHPTPTPNTAPMTARFSRELDHGSK